MSGPFSDWRLLPGLLLAGFVGAGHLAAGSWERRRYPHGRELSMLAGAGLVVFETVEWRCPVFRTLGVLGLFQIFIDHQRLVHTFVTSVREPRGYVRFAGHQISKVIMVAVTPGNIGVTFAVLSSAGRLVVTLVADPDVLPDQEPAHESAR